MELAIFHLRRFFANGRREGGHVGLNVVGVKGVDSHELPFADIKNSSFLLYFGKLGARLTCSFASLIASSIGTRLPSQITVLPNMGLGFKSNRASWLLMRPP